MLHQRFSPDHVASSLLPRSDWRPYPTALDRERWTALAEPVRTRLREDADAALDAPWPHLPATLYLEFARCGNRERFQTPFNQRRAALAKLALGACLEGGETYLDALADAVWSTCEESTWVLPAHTNLQKAGTGLPDVAEPVVDLFAAETSALLAWTLYLLEDALAGVSPRLPERIRRELQVRILQPLFERTDFGWMGFAPGQRVNNWNPWIVSNWLASALVVETDPARRAGHVVKAMRCVDNFIDTYPADGGCDEGPGYWSRAGASLFDVLELLQGATAGAIDVFDEPLIGAMGRYIYRAHLAGPWFTNFADAGAIVKPPPALLYRYGAAIGDADLQAFAGYLRRNNPGIEGARNLPRGLPALFGTAGLETVEPRAPLPRDVWLPDTEFALARSREGSDQGVVLAMKGGHNSESHNHNDVGTFILFHDGRPVLIDAGVETYTRKTFSPERYTIWTMQSAYHNLPTVDGAMQAPGREYAARNAVFECDDETACFRLDLAGAYPQEAGIESWQRTFLLQRSAGLTLTDRCRLVKPGAVVTFSFLTACDVHARPDGVVELTGARLPNERSTGSGLLRYDPERLAVTVEEVPLQDANLTRIWGRRLYRILFEGCVREREASFTFEVAP